MIPETYDLTPSTVRHTKSQTIDSACPTPRHQSSVNSFTNGTRSSSTTQLVPLLRAASTPPERPRIRQRVRTGSKPNRPAASEAEPESNWLRANLSRRKSQYYDEAFASREPAFTAKSRAAKDSLIALEVKMNCCLSSEQEFLVDFTFLISEIYQRPAGCIMVLVNTDFSILLESSPEPAYQISVTALRSEVATTKNKRTVGLIQGFMHESTGIPASRGIFVFHALAEENFVTEDMNSQVTIRHDYDGCAKGVSTVKDSAQQRSHRGRKSSVVRPGTHTPLAQCEIKASANIVSDVPLPQGKVKKRKSLLALLGF